MSSNNSLSSPRTLEQQNKLRHDTKSYSQHLMQIAQHQMEEGQPSKRVKTEPPDNTTDSNPQIKPEFRSASIQLREIPAFQTPATNQTTTAKRRRSLYDVPEFKRSVPAPVINNAYQEHLAQLPNLHGFAPNFPAPVIVNGYRQHLAQQPIPQRPAQNVSAPAIDNDRQQHPA